MNARAFAKKQRRDAVIEFLVSLGIAMRLGPSQERREVIRALYGGQCKHCGFADMRALQIDHIHGDGHRAVGSWAYQLWDISQRPERYQCLCANCNWIKRDVNHEIPYRRPRNSQPDRVSSWIDEWIATEAAFATAMRRRKAKLTVKSIRTRSEILAAMQRIKNARP